MTSTSCSVALHWFVLLSSIVTALVTERSRSKIPPGAFAAVAAGLDSSTTLMAASLLRLRKIFAPSAMMESTVTTRLCKSMLAPVTASRDRAAMSLLWPGAPSRKSRRPTAESHTAATRFVADNSNLYFTSSATAPSRISNFTKS